MDSDEHHDVVVAVGTLALHDMVVEWGKHRDCSGHMVQFAEHLYV
jgi:hypothetical protein